MPEPARQRPNLSHDVSAALRRRLADGLLPAGGRINEVHLADDLGISRTPLREALARLSAEGFVTSRPRRGFFVAPLTREELRELYPLRAHFDPLALQWAGVPPAERLQALRALNDRMARARGASRIIDLDDEWHRLLLAHCPNQMLLAFIDQLIWKTRRYEFAYFSETGNGGVAVDEHEAIVAALEQGDLEAACERLRQNMSSARPELESWLRQRQGETE